MNRILLLVFFCLPTFLSAQSQIEILGSLDYSYRTYSATGLLGSTYNDIEKPKLNYHFTLNYSQQLIDKWWLKVGVGFVSAGYQTKEIGLLFPGDIDPEFGIIHQPMANPPYNVQFTYNQYFLDIPILLYYQFSKKKVSSSVGLGISTLYYLQNSTKMFTDGNLQSKETFRENSYNQIHLVPTLAFDFGYDLGEKWMVFLQPNFRFHLTKTVDALVKEHLWSGGLALGIRRELK